MLTNSAVFNFEEIGEFAELEFRVPEELALDKLAFDYGGERLYRAAYPGYPRNFTRDGLVAARLMNDYESMRAQIMYSARFQGRKADPVNGMEPGKIHHEKHHDMPDVIHNGRSTAYNACDTTALFLESVAELARNENPNILFDLEASIDGAISYIKSHLKDGLFWEDPSQSDADRYGLRVTYWKDSVLNDPKRIEPVYPVVYTQPHFQNAEALLSIGMLRKDAELIKTAEEMYEEGLNRLWADDHFVVAIDQKGSIDPPSSDSLMALLHIPVEILPGGYAAAVEAYMTQLETEAGYLSGKKAGESDDEYHTRYIWTHEQGLLHMAAKRHGLENAMSVCAQSFRYIKAENDEFPELLEPIIDAEGNKKFVAAGNMLQLWSVATYKYFKSATVRQFPYELVPA